MPTVSDIIDALTDAVDAIDETLDSADDLELTPEEQEDLESLKSDLEEQIRHARDDPEGLDPDVWGELLVELTLLLPKGLPLPRGLKRALNRIVEFLARYVTAPFIGGALGLAQALVWKRFTDCMNACRGSKPDVECARDCAESAGGTVQVRKWLLMKWRESQLEYEEDEVSLEFDGTVPVAPLGVPVGYPGERGCFGVVYLTPRLDVETDPVPHVVIEFDDPFDLMSGATFTYDVGEPRPGTVDSTRHTVSNCPPDGATALRNVTVDLCGHGSHNELPLRRRETVSEEAPRAAVEGPADEFATWVLEAVGEEGATLDEVLDVLVEHPEFRSRVKGVLARWHESGSVAT